MPKGFIKGKSGNPKGKKPGTQNKNTKDIKEAYRLLIESNLDNLTKWVEAIAEKDPEKAIKILSDLSEYVIPKLARKEFEGEIKQDITTRVIFEDNE
jgi:nitrogen regulatory protein PII-like uncharacterized protein